VALRRYDRRLVLDNQMRVKKLSVTHDRLFHEKFGGDEKTSFSVSFIYGARGRLERLVVGTFGDGLRRMKGDDRG
jgi:hypothetical protein